MGDKGATTQHTDAMTRPQIKARILNLLNQREKMEAAWKPVLDAFKTHDFPAWEQSYTVLHMLEDAVAREIGDPLVDGEHGSWLAWFIYDNRLGQRAMEAKAASWKQPRAIRTVEDLVDVICADRRTKK
jgi:hypothetical protein